MSAQLPPAGIPPEASVDGERFYVMVDGVQQGPLDVADLRRKAEAGTLGRQTPVWRHGMEVWRAAANVPSLAGLFAETAA